LSPVVSSCDDDLIEDRRLSISWPLSLRSLHIRTKATAGLSMRPNPPVETCDEQAPPATLFRRRHAALHGKIPRVKLTA
jgi:hypothetical protein